MFPNINNEQHELVLNHVCAMFQPLLWQLGSDKLSDEILNAFIQLVIDIFTKTNKVSTGGVLIIHGLVISVDTRLT